MLAFILSFAGFARADAILSAHTAKRGHLTIASPTDVGGVTLQPGEYEVEESNSPSGPVIEFVHQFRNELASELVQADEEEVVALVPFTAHVLSSPPQHTQLILASHTADVSGLQIRGDHVSYAFAPLQRADRPETTAVCINAGQQ
jgi:hypothetical protein